MSQLAKGKRVSGELREQVRAQLVERYEAGESIRSLTDDSGRSYGFIHGLLNEAGVQFRSRGGARNTRTADAEPAEDSPSDEVAGSPKKGKKKKKKAKGKKGDRASEGKPGKGKKQKK